MNIVSLVVVGLGCMLSFVLGAYIRAPFKILGKEEPDKEVGEDKISEEELRKRKEWERQFSNIMNYNGEVGKYED